MLSGILVSWSCPISEKCWRADSGGMSLGEPVLLLAAAIGKRVGPTLSKAKWESCLWYHRHRRVDGMTNSAIIQAQVPGSGLAYPNIYLI